jgi:hypothetical protein
MVLTREDADVTAGLVDGPSLQGELEKGQEKATA